MEDEKGGDEKILAAYVSAELNFGPLSVYPGLRYEYTDYSATYWAVDGASGGFKSFGSDYGEVLPANVMSALLSPL